MASANSDADKVQCLPRGQKRKWRRFQVMSGEGQHERLASPRVYPNKMDAEQRQKIHFGFLCFMSGVEPKDELEGMIASQLLASHNAAMECYRRAMLPEQTFEGRRENLGQANKLSRTHATLLEALNRHRGKGQQKVTVEHVHVHEGGQAIVGNVQGGGVLTKSENQPHALAYASDITMLSADQTRELLPVPSDESVPDARRNVTRSPEGE